MTVTAERIRGALLGCLLGDAFGRPLKCVSASDSRLAGWVARRSSGSDPLGYSDDAEMMMLVAESLVACGHVDGEHLLRWMARHHDPARGYGKGTRAVFAALARGSKRAAHEFFPDGSQGNGAAAVDGAVVMARAIAALLRSNDIDLTQTSLLARASDATLSRKLALIPRLLDASPAQAAALLGNGVLAVDSVPVALWSFLRGAPDFESVIVQAALGGGDVDTICAMSGALAGALVGEAGLPRSWLARAEGRERTLALADAIYSHDVIYSH